MLLVAVSLREQQRHSRGCSRVSYLVSGGRPWADGPMDIPRFTRTVLDVVGPCIGTFGMISESCPANECGP